MYKNLLILLLCIISAQNVKSARILAVIQTASYSHQMFYQQLWRELAIRGHDIVVITSDPTGDELPNFREISIEESYPLTRKAINMAITESLFKVLFTNAIHDIFLDIADFQLSIPEVQKIINNKTEHFDLLMVEHMMPLVFGFKHRFNCPMIGLTSLDASPYVHAAMGNSVHAILYPLSFFAFQDNMTFAQRLFALFISNWFEYTRNHNAYRMDQITKTHFGSDTPHIYELIEDTDMLFVNANPVFTPIRPFTPSTISIAGGMHLKPEKPLPKELNDFLDNGKDGVIYFSLGSNVKSKELSIEMRQAIMDTLSQVPYKVLWKFEDDTLPGKPDNVKIIKWAPQQDVLRHENVKLFVTQGGMQSLEEALYSHVPMVTLPFFADQDSNAEKVGAKELGVILDRHNFNAKDFKSALLEVMENPKYRNNVKMWANRIQDEPMKPLDKAIWWTEYVLRHKGAKHLKGPRIPAYQYYYFDVLAFLGCALGALGVLFYCIAKLLTRTFYGMFRSQNKVKKL